MPIIIIALLLVFSTCTTEKPPVGEAILKAYDENVQYASTNITYPRDGALFPPDIAAPTFTWKSASTGSDTWLVKLKFQDSGEDLNFLLPKAEWAPKETIWSEIKRRSIEKDATLKVLGVRNEKAEKILCAGEVTFRTSKDEVGAPIFYREVNLPFVEAVTDPSAIVWRFGSVDSTTQPPVVLEKMPVCGNCHSFSNDGSRMGMDVDYGNDKGSYALLDLKPEMVIAKEKIISWSDYKKEDEELTFGLLSRISPDGRYVVGTVKDLSIFMPKPDLAFSQLFFPIKGILVVYDRETKKYTELPGASDKTYVQSNPVWSPDGKYIVFIRARAVNINLKERKLFISDDEVLDYLGDDKSFRYDLYRIPFNEGKGGVAVPVAGASKNGMSNYFPTFSPDGRWLVFCKAKSYSLLQPDSELYIVPATGGKARRLRGNTSRMNSWHSFSPNSKWLVFSSKENGPYTQLFLTHIDDSGESSPPVLLSNFTSVDRAANIPEFVNTTSDAIRNITFNFLDDQHMFRIGDQFLTDDKTEKAYEAYKKGLVLNPKNSRLHNNIGTILANKGRLKEASEHFEAGLKYGSDDAELRENLGRVYLVLGKKDLALSHLLKSIALNPRAGGAHLMLCELSIADGKISEAAVHFENALAVAKYVNDFAFFARLARTLGGEQTYTENDAARPSDREKRECLADYFEKNDRLGEVIENYRKGLRKKERDAMSLYALGVILANKSYLAYAVELLEYAIDLMPSNEKFQQDLEVLKRELGKKP